MNRYADISSTLVDCLRLALPPIAVCLTDRAPEGIPSYEGAVPAGCVFWEKAISGAFATSTRDHELCSIGVYTHNMVSPSSSYKPELKTVLKVLDQMQYVRSQDVAEIPVSQREVSHVVYAPLAATPLPPDVVLLFAHSGQGLVITEAVQRIDEDIPPALGRPACAVVAQALNRQRAALSLGCCGARAYLDALSDDIALWALPAAKLERYASCIETLAKANEVLGKLHRLRRIDVEAGRRPTYEQSMVRLES
ncbi:MAG: DUF169 domain-containing protein [Acidiferrobacterales bacterium]|nr:DUF169 domain-containing protein [Acidiferrobacterales bacterium]